MTSCRMRRLDVGQSGLGVLGLKKAWARKTMANLLCPYRARDYNKTETQGISRFAGSALGCILAALQAANLRCAR